MAFDLADLNGIDMAAQMDALDRVDCEESLYVFVQHMWHVVEPATPLVGGWAMQAICEHLEAVTYGEITRLLINVPPGSSKSLLCNVFWPAWEWAKAPHLRFLSFSYAAHLTERDNRKFRDVICSRKYQALFGDRFRLIKKGEEYVSNSAMGFKVATSIGGVGTGERGDRVICDDPHNVKDQESDIIRKGTVEWYNSAMSNRLNDMEKSAIVTIMQRVHEDDVSGNILEKELPYEHLMIPAEYESERRFCTSIGWEDPREKEGESFWPERFPDHVLELQKKLMGPFGYSGQYQQRPDPAGGGIVKRDWWTLFSGKNYPPMDYIVAYLDTAYTIKTVNDPSAMVVFGVFTGDSHAQATRSISRDGQALHTERVYVEGAPKVMMLYAWQKRLELHGVNYREGDKLSSDLDDPNDGLIEKVAKIAKAFRIDLLLIENKAAGISVSQELRRLYSNERFGVQLHDPKSQDKVSRLYSVQHLFSEGMIYAPDRPWADMVISQVAQFPRGKHDDLVDCCSGALRHLRDIGLLTRVPERLEEIELSKQYSRQPEPLYPA